MVSAWGLFCTSVENLSDAKSIAYACAELSSLAASRALNARDVAGSLLAVCCAPAWCRNSATCAAQSAPTCFF
jgi:hypothetical protein